MHRYKKINLGRNGNDFFVYRCMKPACSHYISVALAEGSICECDRCHEPMIIGKETLQGSSGRALTRVHCSSCTKSRHRVKKSETVDAIAEYLNKRL